MIGASEAEVANPDGYRERPHISIDNIPII
jgi:hypothetical protein